MGPSVGGPLKLRVSASRATMLSQSPRRGAENLVDFMTGSVVLPHKSICLGH